MVPGCIRHCHCLDTSSQENNSFQLVSVRNMTSTLVWRRFLESCFMIFCTLINIHYTLILRVTFTSCQNSPKTRDLEKKKVGNRKAKKPLVKEWTQGKKMQWRDRRKSSISQEQRNNKIEEHNSSGFLRFSCFNIVARRSTFLPHIWVCKLYWFPHRGKEGKKKVLFPRKSCLSWLSTKEKCQQEDVRPKDLQSQRKTTPSFTGKESRVHNTLLKRLNLHRIGVWNILCYCAHMNCADVSVTVSAVVEVFSLILRLSFPVFLRPAGSSCGRWAADGPLCWRPSPPVGEGRPRRRAGTDTWADRKSGILFDCDVDSVNLFLPLTVCNDGWYDS